MFFELLNNLTTIQREQLAAAGIPSPRVSEWKKRKYIPGRSHTLALARVTGADLDTLNRELTVLEAERDSKKNPAFARLASDLQTSIRNL